MKEEIIKCKNQFASIHVMGAFHNLGDKQLLLPPADTFENLLNKCRHEVGCMAGVLVHENHNKQGMDKIK
jgi:hypothetical protein